MGQFKDCNDCNGGPYSCVYCDNRELEAKLLEQEGVITCLNSDIAGALADRKSLEAEVARLREELAGVERARLAVGAGLDRVCASLVDERAAHEATKTEETKQRRERDDMWRRRQDNWRESSDRCLQAAEARAAELETALDQARELLEAIHESKLLHGNELAPRVYIWICAHHATPAATEARAVLKECEKLSESELLAMTSDDYYAPDYAHDLGQAIIAWKAAKEAK